MRFYYVSLVSVFLIVFIWLIGTGLLAGLRSLLRKTYKRVWPVMVPLFLLVYVSPIAEELWIAWNFGRLCEKDAGIFIYKTVEVDGFYDDTTHWWRQLAESKYQFVESRDRTYGGLYRVERDGDSLKHFEINEPTARYHYRWPHMSSKVAHKIVKGERLVVDSQSGEVLGRYLNYARGAPWFFVGLDAPKMGCSEKKEDQEKLGGAFGPSSVLTPKQ